ncbi:PAS domain S-box protein [Ciceribacter sp. L1K23]|uniref:two-component system sensor histidine kinase NtrB n=1 Tax=Ciceribacter sp. L1K23 TaxID=2820276 RepID=UPI001B81D0F4|nr:ATP-binding protein [Ciceribacter sp. L1K23]MBR0554058.1 PAS domain S-box protein [Ciceribacter sp. L1K23]
MVWIVDRGESEQARVKIATDALWVEQTLRFQLSIHEDLLVRLALEPPGDDVRTVVDPRVKLHIATNPEVQSVIWYDGGGRIAHALPGNGSPQDHRLVELLREGGARATRPVYGDVTEDGLVVIALPLTGSEGVVSATISIPILLERHVPWWIAEQYGVRVVTAAEDTVAARQKLEPAVGNPQHAISFDPPLRGMLLQITAYDTPAAFRSALLLGTIAALATFAILSLLVVYTNARRRRRAELRLRGETAFRQAMEESLTVGLRAKDNEGRILYVNSAFCNLVGWKAEEIVGRLPPMPYWDPSRVGEAEERQKRLTANGAFSPSFETRFRHRSGREIDVQVYEAPLIDASGVHRGWMGSVIDITEAKNATRRARAQDEAMARTGRLVTLGEMASTLAHELNQPLSAISSYATGMLNLLDRDDFDAGLFRGVTEKLAQQAARAGFVIQRVQDLARKREPHFSEIQIDQVIRETIALLAADAREHRVKIVADMEPARSVAADTILLEQLLINLIRNGMEAMADRRTGDTLTIKLLERGDNAIIEIADQGAGIDPDVENRLFEAFASTKAQGLGMGLAICRSIVELHGGHLSFRYGENRGTVFVVQLPLAQREKRAMGEVR